jgi:hypothetical protein
MIQHDADDPLLQQLRLLRPAVPDPARAERVRARCRARLARARPRERPGRFRAFAGRVLPPLVVGCVSVAYFVDLLVIALRVYGLL